MILALFLVPTTLNTFINNPHHLCYDEDDKRGCTTSHCNIDGGGEEKDGGGGEETEKEERKKRRKVRRKEEKEEEEEKSLMGNDGAVTCERL